MSHDIDYIEGCERSREYEAELEWGDTKGGKEGTDRMPDLLYLTVGRFEQRSAVLVLVLVLVPSASLWDRRVWNALAPCT